MKTVRLGVDFGTSNTVAVLELPNREPRPLLFDGSPLLPSAVAADAGGRLVVGRDALHTATIDPGSFEPHPKRCIDDESVLLGDRAVPVVDLIAAVLQRVVGEAERAAGGAPTEIVLTCPAGWATGRRDILRQALPGAQLLEEPVAAANHLGDDLPVGHTAVVYDFGAGTFDASVIRRTATGFAVLATEGLTDCGGLDIDAAIVASLSQALSGREEWNRLVEPKSAADRRASRQLWDNVRQAKEMLSRSTSTLVHVPLVDVEVPVGREQLDEAAAPVLERTVGAVKAALRTAGVDGAGAILLCGGSSRMPAVTTVLHRAFGVEPTVVDQPELAVAEGSIRRAPAAPAPADPSWPTVDLTKRPAVPPRRLLADPRLRVGAAAAAVLVAAAAVTAVFSLSGRGDVRERGAALAAASASGPASASASPSPSVSYAPGVDPCLVGAWRELSNTRTNTIDGKKVQFVRVSGTKTGRYNADGTNSVVFDNLLGTATVNGAKWEEIINGWATGTFTAGNGTIIYTSWAPGGTWELRRNGRRNTGAPLTMSIEPESYVCTPTTLTIGSSFYTETWTRI